MADNKDFIPCPLCEGNAQLRRSELAERVRKLNLASVAEAEPDVAARTARTEPGVFHKEVHHWNPQMPIFNRSPKE
jgi:hypothetical protein